MNEIDDVSALHNACVNNDFDFVSKLFEKDPANIIALINCKDTNANSLCILCASSGNYRLLELMVKNGANVDYQNSAGDTCLHVSVELGHIDCVVCLLGVAGLNINLANNKGCTALYVAARDNKHEILKVLLQQINIDINKSENNHWTPIAAASSAGHIQCVTMLHEAGCNIDTINKTNRSPVYHAASAGHLDCLDYLIKAGADINAYSNKGFTPLSAAALGGEKECMSLLLESGADMTIVNNVGWTVCHAAVSTGKKTCLDILITHGADYTRCRSDGMSPTALAASTEKVACLEILTSRGVDINTCDQSGRSLAFYAATSKTGKLCLELLLTKGVSVNQSIIPYCLKGHVLKSPTTKNVHRICELCRKTYAHKPTCLQCFACAYDWCTSCVEERRAGWTLLHAAASGGSVAVDTLLAAGADIHATDHLGNTALFAAAQSESNAATACIKLFKAGANLLHVNKLKKRALDVATHDNMKGILNGLKDIQLDENLWTDGSCYLWFYVLQLGHEFDDSCNVIIRKALDQYKDKLIVAKNAFGHSCFNVASPNNRLILQEYAYFCGRFDIDVGPPLHCSASSVVMSATDYGLMSLYEKHYDVYTPMDKSNFRSAIGMVGDVLNMSQKWLTQQQLYYTTNDMHLPILPDGVEVVPSPLWSDQVYLDVCKLNDDSVLMSKAVFIEYCQRLYGSSRRVVVKFMSAKDQYDREVNVRSVGQFDSKFVVGIIKDSPDADIIRKAIATLSLPFIQAHKYAIILYQADRSLDAIFRQERPDAMHIVLMMKEVALAVKHVHDRGVIHGDLKLLNVLRIDGRMQLVDMDAAAVIGESYGAKYSSANLPPECFYSLTNGSEIDAYCNYWKSYCLQDSALWRKIRPVDVRSTGFHANSYHLVVKTFQSLSNPVLRSGSVSLSSTLSASTLQSQLKQSVPVLIPVDRLTYTDDTKNSTLPYYSSIIRAHPRLDIWSFGMMLYTLCCGKSLLSCNRDDDIGDKASWLRVYTWTDAELQSIIRDNINDISLQPAVDLLMKIFHVNPKDRIQSMDDILHHAFFTGKSINHNEEIMDKLGAIMNNQQQQMDVLNQMSSQLIQIEKYSSQFEQQLNQTQSVLLRGIFEATEVTTPTCFIIVNQKLVPIITRSSSKDKVVVENESKAARASQWLESLCNITHDISHPGKFIEQTITDRFVKEEKLYFYLIDEVTMQPIIPLDETDIYPIEIITYKQSDMLIKLLPLMQVSLKAMTLLNSASGIARCLGYPVPCISDEVMSKSGQWLEKLSKTSSIEDYDSMQKVLHTPTGTDATNEDNNQTDASNGSDIKSVRGGPLRELTRFLNEHDPNNQWSNLIRIVDSRGVSCWTVSENISSVMVVDVSVGGSSNSSDPMSQRNKFSNITPNVSASPPIDPVPSVIPVMESSVVLHSVTLERAKDEIIATLGEQLIKLNATVSRLVDQQQQQIINQQSSVDSPIYSSPSTQSSQSAGQAMPWWSRFMKYVYGREQSQKIRPQGSP